MALLEVSNTLFTDRNNYGKVTDKEKEDFFFIINRNIAKKYPLLAQKLNHKEIDKVAAMDCLFTQMHILGETRYNKWFWGKSNYKKEKSLKPSEHEMMMKVLGLEKDEDVDYLMKWFEEEFKEELKYYNKLKKENSK